MAIKALLFDKDGTLADFQATFNSATGQVLKKLFPDDEKGFMAAAKAVSYDSKTGIIGDDSIIVAGSGVDIASAIGPILGRENVVQFSVELDRMFGEECIKTVTELPFASKTLRKLHSEGFLLGVATNDSEVNAVNQMKALGLDALFVRIIGADSGFGAKPGPGMVTQFIEDCRCQPSEVVMVGDSIHDLQAGRAAGALTCAVLTGPATRRELDPFADWVLSSIDQLPETIASN